MSHSQPSREHLAHVDRIAQVCTGIPEHRLGMVDEVLHRLEMIENPAPVPPILERLFPEEVIELPYTSGSEIIIGKYGREVFGGNIDSGFGHASFRHPSRAMGKQLIELYRLVRPATARAMVRSTGRAPEDLCLTQHQIIAFARNPGRWIDPAGALTLAFLSLPTAYHLVALSLIQQSPGAAFPSPEERRKCEPNMRVDLERFDDRRQWHPEQRVRLILPQFEAKAVKEADSAS